MRATRDSFLHFMADNLPSRTVHPVRREVDRPDSDKLQMNAINVKFLNSDFTVHGADQLVVIDVIYDDELTALDVAREIWTILSSSSYTPKLDYTDPSNPVDTGYWIFWDTEAKFRPIFSPMYSQLHLQLHLKHIAI